MKNKISRDLAVVTHDVAEPSKESGACSNLGMHCTVDVIQQVQCLTNQLVAFVKQTLLDLGLATCEYMVSITCLQRSSDPFKPLAHSQKTRYNLRLLRFRQTAQPTITTTACHAGQQ